MKWSFDMNIAVRRERKRLRRGISLLVVVAVMGITAGLLSVLVAQNMDMYRRLWLDRARCTARASSSSVAEYAERYQSDLAGIALDTPMTLDTSALTSGGMESQAEIRLVSEEDGYALRMTTRVERGRIAIEHIEAISLNEE